MAQPAGQLLVTLIACGNAAFVGEFFQRLGEPVEFRADQLSESRCSLLGYALKDIKVEGTYLARELLEVHRQQEVGQDGYDQGAAILLDFFKKELAKYLTPELDPLGKQIIDCCLNDGTVADYLDLIPMRY